MRKSLSVETNKQSQLQQAECPSPPADRPKTSRGVQSPSPDQFTSYVVPSPKFVRQLEPQKEASVMSFHSRGADSEDEREDDSEEVSATDETVSSDSDSLSGPFSEAHLFSCWLFGVALRA